MVAVLAGSAACSLESALGVDDDGSTGSMPPPAMTTTTPPMADSTAGDTGTPPGTDGDDSSVGSGPPDSACAGAPVRVATYNVRSVGEPGDDSFTALTDVLLRIDADVVCLQEVQEWETARLFSLATAAGYDDAIQANPPPAIGGEHTNACMSRLPLTLVGSYGGSDLSSDAQANDVGRDILVVQADLSERAGAPCRLGLATVHLKSGQEPLDWFRRQVEAERLVQAYERYQAEFPGDAFAVLGDFNENDDDPALGTVFESAPPTGLPRSYRLGADIGFPLSYQPFERLSGLGFLLVDATQEDSGSYDTWSNAVRLDYVAVHSATVVGDEVYNACRDNGVDDPPKGDFIPKAGRPLPCAVSELASDHFPVVADLVIP